MCDADSDQSSDNLPELILAEQSDDDDSFIENTTTDILSRTQYVDDILYVGARNTTPIVTPEWRGSSMGITIPPAAFGRGYGNPSIREALRPSLVPELGARYP